MTLLQQQVVQSLEGLSDDSLHFLLEMINKYIKKNSDVDNGAEELSVVNRIGALKGVEFFAQGYDFDEDNEEIAKLFGEM